MIVLVGLNHDTAPVEIRERLAYREVEVPDALERLAEHDPIEECLILSTCNRVEVLVRGQDNQGAADSVKRFLAGERRVALEQLNGHLYVRHDEEAVRHLFEVACGLDSMILGEPQILGQIKQAYAVARKVGSTGPVLDHLLQQGFSAAKQVRTDTGIARNAVSVAFAAVELARKIFGELTGRSVLVIGAGKMADLATKHLVANGIEKIFVTSRNISRAAGFARKFGGESVEWEQAWKHLEQVDVVVAGTAAPGTVLHRRDVQKMVRARRSRPLFIIDIAVPRDVEPAINDLPNVYLYDIDDLQGIIDDNLQDRRRAAIEARRMVDVHVRSFQHWQRSLGVAPTIVALRENLLDVGRQEIERFHRKLGRMSPEQAQAVEELTRAVIQKILHPPIRQLKKLADRGDADRYAALYREIFGIEGEVEPAETAAQEDPARKVVREEES
jgi:glutamyl-tRNA reductase